MPYIKNEARTALDPYIDQLADQISGPGPFAYVLYSLLGRLTFPHSYGTFAMYSGVVTETLAEFRRRVIVPYEQEKCEGNGDV
jgi:hypothetical protein